MNSSMRNANRWLERRDGGKRNCIMRRVCHAIINIIFYLTLHPSFIDLCICLTGGLLLILIYTSVHLHTYSMDLSDAQRPWPRSRFSMLSAESQQLWKGREWRRDIAGDTKLVTYKGLCCLWSFTLSLFFSSLFLTQLQFGFMCN